MIRLFYPITYLFIIHPSHVWGTNRNSDDSSGGSLRHASSEPVRLFNAQFPVGPKTQRMREEACRGFVPRLKGAAVAQEEERLSTNQKIGSSVRNPYSLHVKLGKILNSKLLQSVCV